MQEWKKQQKKFAGKSEVKNALDLGDKNREKHKNVICFIQEVTLRDNVSHIYSNLNRFVSVWECLVRW